MRTLLLTTAVVGFCLGAPLLAEAQVVQDTVEGTQNGFNRGNAAAGPVGGIIGGALGAGVGAATGAVGTASGIVGSVFGVPDDRPRFRDYAVARPSSAYDGDVRVGSILPRRGIALYAVPRDYHVSPRYRYAVVNDRAVIVDPRSRRVVDVID